MLLLILYLALGCVLVLRGLYRMRWGTRFAKGHPIPERFEVPERAAADPRRFGVRILVHGMALMGVGNFAVITAVSALLARPKDEVQLFGEQLRLFSASSSPWLDVAKMVFVNSVAAGIYLWARARRAAHRDGGTGAEQRAPLSGGQSRATGVLLVAAGTLLNLAVVALCVCLTVQVGFRGGVDGPLLIITPPVVVFLSPALFTVGLNLRRRGRRHLVRIITSPGELTPDGYVLYLRSFTDDAPLDRPQRREGSAVMHHFLISGRSEEEQLAAALRDLGPLVAVGEPGERLPYVGASRLYLPLDDWQDTVRDMMLNARLVVLALGTGPGTLWELVEAMRILPPERLVLLVPMEHAAYDDFRAIARRELSILPDPPPLPPYAPDPRQHSPAMPARIRAAVHYSRATGGSWRPYFVWLDAELMPMVRCAEFRDKLYVALRHGLRPVVDHLLTGKEKTGQVLPSMGVLRRLAFVLVVGAAVVTGGTLYSEHHKPGGAPDDKPAATHATYDAASHRVVNPSRTRGGTLRFVGTEDADSWDPQRADYAFVRDFMRYYTRQLVTYRPAPGARGHELVPDLATSTARVGDGGRSYTYTLKKGVTWEDGRPITSRDVKYGIERGWARGTAPPQGPAYLRDAVESVTTPDSRTVVFHLLEPVGDFEQMLAMPAGSPARADKGATAAEGTRDPKGTEGGWPFSSGPYRWDSYRPGHSLTLVRNPHWRRATDPVRTALPDRITLRILGDPAAAERGLLAGTYDLNVLGTGLGQRAYDETRAEGRESSLDNPRSGYVTYAAFAGGAKPLDDVHCRRAVMYAADLTAAREASSTLLAADVATTVLPPVMPGSRPDRDPYGIAARDGRPDLAKARAELRACGRPHGFTTTIVAAADEPDHRAVAVSLREALRKAGIRARTTTYEGTRSATVGDPDVVARKGYGIVVDGWYPDLPSARTMLPWLAHSAYIQPAGGNRNYPLLSDRSLDRQLDAAMAQRDPRKAAAQYAAADAALARHAVYLPVTFEKEVRWRAPRLTNVFTSVSFNERYDYARLGVRR
ncbi:ABC transporter substrate-binding protein [Actinomycetota bacterium Odt1-20B]